MTSDNFLMDIIFGALDLEHFRTFQEAGLDEKADRVVREYIALNAEYPAAYMEEQKAIPGKAMQRLKQIGFFGLNIPVRYGGLGLSLRQYLNVVEKIIAPNMSLGLTALAHLSIGTKGIVLFGNEWQKKRYLSPAASGEMIFSYALTEPKKGSDARNIETTATLSDDGQSYILNGSKAYITNANYAGGLTVFAQMDPQTPGFMGAFIVETGWDGVKIGKDMPKMGLTASSTASVQFRNVRVPKENLLGRPGDGFKIAMTILNYGRLALGAGSAGMMKQSLQEMIQRSASRTQFGVPINSFELIQEKLVKAEVNSTVAAAVTAFTAGMLEKDPLAAVAIESSHCKLFGTTRAWDTLYDALQVAGGSGYLSTQPYERRMRDFRVTTIFEGTTEIHSIYPALFVMRRLTKRMQALYTSRIMQILFLIKGMGAVNRWKIAFGGRQMKRAVRFAKSNARRIRLLIHAGMLIYGKNVIQKEFLLRRITHLSLYLFGTLAMLARIDAIRKAGGDLAQDLQVLDYFVEEGRQSRKRSKRLFPNALERLHRKIADNIRAEATASRTNQIRADSFLKVNAKTYR